MEDTANKSYNITTNGDTIIPGKFLLIGIAINTKGASGSTVKVYDSASTTENLKATIDTTITIGMVPFPLPVFNGIFIRTGGGSTAGDLTVFYREMP